MASSEGLDAQSGLSNTVGGIEAPPRRLEAHLILQWIPSHYQIAGNEQADRLSKAGSGMRNAASRPTVVWRGKIHPEELIPYIMEDTAWSDDRR